MRNINLIELIALFLGFVLIYTLIKTILQNNKTK